MLRYFVKRSVKENFEQVSIPPKHNVWVRANKVNDSDLHHLADTFGLDLNVLRDVLDKDELPRVEFRDGGTYVFIRVGEQDKHGHIVTTPILLAVKGTIFANISTSPIDDNKLETPRALVQDTTDVTGLLLGTLAGVLSEYEEFIKHTARYIRDTANRLRTHEVTNDDFIHFVTIEDNLNEYRMNLDGTLAVAQRLKETFKDSRDHEAVEDIILYIHQLLVAIDSHRQTITSIRNAYGTVANNSLNRRMKTLTIIMLLVALPNVFFGMYGMNVGLPFQDEAWIYGAIIMLTIVVVVATAIITRRRGIF